MANVQEIKREDLQRLLERARPALNEAEYEQLKAALDTLVYLTQLLGKKSTTIQRLRQILFGASSEKTAEVLKAMVKGVGREGSSLDPGGEETAAASAVGEPVAGDAHGKAKGHGRNGAQHYPGANTVCVAHPEFKAGERCPQCRRGKLYPFAPGVLVRVVGQAPLTATVYEIEKLRCNLCLEVFSAPTPAGVGAHKYDAGAASMIALLKYGSGVPFYRLQGLQESLGVPLPAATQWEIAKNTAALIKPAFDELIRQGAQGEVLHNDDTTMKILGRVSEGLPEAPQRTGVFTSGIVCRCQQHTIALFFTGARHAGENLARVLAHRAQGLAAPIQMCDALSRNVPAAFETIVANCLAHARRKYVEVVPQFPEACRFVLENLAEVYRHDAHCRQQHLKPGERLLYHQQHSGAPMERIECWMAQQLDEHRVEPNGALGEAMRYMRKHWKELTLFLRTAGAPLDNNITEQCLNRAILHRKNALFYKSDQGAQVGDTFMSLIHTCALAQVNPFDYLTALQANAAALSENPGQWLPWNYRGAGLSP
ncbi:MAG: IS66 family transposase [Acidobacteria bacterium]|nr:IS66 family transposase [Acidobacteriota bacterium]